MCEIRQSGLKTPAVFYQAESVLSVLFDVYILQMITAIPLLIRSNQALPGLSSVHCTFPSFFFIDHSVVGVHLQYCLVSGVLCYRFDKQREHTTQHISHAAGW